MENLFKNFGLLGSNELTQQDKAEIENFDKLIKKLSMKQLEDFKNQLNNEIGNRTKELMLVVHTTSKVVEIVEAKKRGEKFDLDKVLKTVQMERYIEDMTPIRKIFEGLQ